MRLIVVSFCLFFGLSSGQYPEASQELDYQDVGGRTLGTNSGPTLVGPNHELKGFEPIYVSPDLEDILDRQSFNVYHEQVHGSILMPRISFALNDDDQPMGREQDYDDYINLVPGVDPKFYGRKRNQRRGLGGASGGAGGCGPNCVPRGQNPMRPAVPMFPNPLYNPTIEEMIPWARIKDTPDTYIVMADDPVLAVDSVPKCSKNANKNEPQAGKPRSGEEGAEGGDGSSEAPPEGEASTAGEEGVDAKTAPDGEEGSTAAEGGESSEGTEGTTAGGEESSTAAGEERRRRKRRSLLFN